MQDFPDSPLFFLLEEKHMSNLTMGLCGKLGKSVSWSTFAPLDNDLASG